MVNITNKDMENTLQKLNKEEILQAIKEGVKEAIHEMMESGNGYTGPIRSEEILQHIKEGVDSAFCWHLNLVNIGQEIRQGTEDAMENLGVR